MQQTVEARAEPGDRASDDPEPGADERSREQALVARALRGDGRGYRALVEPHLPMLYRLAARAAGDRALAEDAVQETLALAYRRLSGWRPEQPFRAFLAAVAVRQAHTLRRSERRRERREAEHGPATTAEPAADPLDAMRGRALAERVREALMSLPPKRREAALLRLDAGLGYREIASAIGSTEGSARVLVCEALRELREKLRDELGETP
jgi:RNA polymerase sigma-70 factor (ECF subfamily)